MKRTTTFYAAMALLVGAATFGVACGDEAEPPQFDRSRLAPAQPMEEKSDARRAAETGAGEVVVEDLVVWPADAGEPRDARADYRECQSRLNQAHDVRTAHPLVQFQWMRTCMTDKGWATNPDAGIPEG